MCIRNNKREIKYSLTIASYPAPPLCTCSASTCRKVSVHVCDRKESLCVWGGGGGGGGVSVQG